VSSSKKYYDKNRKMILEKQKLWRDSPEGQLKERARHLKRKFGITIEDYDRMFKEQDGKCKICSTESFGDSRCKYFTVDHCHDTGNIRGLLCNRCNTALGLLDDNVNVLNSAILYLKGDLNE
jgi:hypothetical protein